MEDWHMPNTSSLSYIPDLRTDYYLTGGYMDTQLLGLMLYGAYYYSHFDIVLCQKCITLVHVCVGAMHFYQAFHLF